MGVVYHSAMIVPDEVVVCGQPGAVQFLGNPTLCVTGDLTGRTYTPSDQECDLPGELLVGALGHQFLVRLRQAITLRIRKEGDEFVVWHDLLPGEARAPYSGDAVARYRSDLSRRFLALRAQAPNLDPEAARELALLEQYIEERTRPL
jgi:hypothetical protein